MKLEFKNVTKQYGEVNAVNEVNCVMEKGIYGLLGVNGAGKTTLMRMICTIIQPSKGQILWNGEDIWKLGGAYREILGYLPQDFGYYPDLSVYDYMMYISSIKGLKITFARKKVKQLLNQVGMEKFSKRKMKNLSGGMVRRVGIAQAMLNDPKILVLDEPTAGLDPNERIRFRNLISELSEERLVLLSTHIVSDIEYIANDIMLMKDGKLFYTGTAKNLLSSMKEKVWQCHVPRNRVDKYMKEYLVRNIKTTENGAELRIISREKPAEDAMLVEKNLKINVLAIGLALILAVIFSGFAVTGNRYVDENGNVSTGIMATRKLTVNRRAWKGILTEDELAKVIAQNKNAMTQSSEEEDANYGKRLQPIDEIKNFMISVLTPDSEYDESVLDQMSEENVQSFYDIYQKNMKKMAEEYGKTSAQKEYLEKKYSEIKLPLKYEAYSSWDTMIMYAETYSIILAIIVGFICAGIFADDFQTKADAVFFSTKYGRTKAVKTKILAGIATTAMIYCSGIILLSMICFGIMGISGVNTLYQMYQAYSIYIMTYGQYYLLTVVCGFIASLLAASLSMLVAAKMHTISVAVCIPFFLYCLLPFIGRALSGYTTIFNLIPTILTNVEASARVPLIYQIGNHVFRQIPLVMLMYTIVAIALIPLIYRSFHRYGKK
jgi:ABC-type multidrug transport system ATPase subunit/ABC-type transport system involved in multi-copper enzyme maturation permease subunit